ncbi:MAG TPA: CocE/NonD family hydrolase [Candidatus Thermoplasmatota archaeon]|nr:CocE/NonD family hydrolase [Candidatus Thermoplasmatota archaeon]
MPHAGRALTLVFLLTATALAGCLAGEAPASLDQAGETVPPIPYKVPEPDLDLPLLEHAELIPMPMGDVQIHARIVRPDTDEPVPVIVQFTPYTAPGRGMLIEPMVSAPGGAFVNELVRRGYAFAFADVRGTGDSGGCLDLRGQLDIEDAWHLTEFLGTQEWSNGKVGFIGASYPGSEAHIAAIAGNPHLGGVIPVVASTSFYSYHHKNGVPYVNHLATNTGYTQNAVTPTKNPQYENWVTRQVREPVECDTTTHLTEQLDQSGTYDAWWADRNLRPRVHNVTVPVLMAQGLADWNVKPDHIAEYYNNLKVRKILIAGQWGHQFPNDAPEAYGAWWEYATAFFDETLKGIPTGLFDEDKAYVQDTEGNWNVYPGEWPPLNARQVSLNLTANGLSPTEAPSGSAEWEARMSEGQGGFTSLVAPDSTSQVVLTLPPLSEAMHVSGVPRLNLTVITAAENVHLVAVLEVNTGKGWTRENYGYLNPIYRNGVDKPERVVPGKPTPVTIEMYPQEDIFPKGAELRLILRSVDEGRTVAVFDEGPIQVQFDGERPGQLWIPLSPLAN